MIIEINEIQVELKQDKRMRANSLAVVKFPTDKRARLQLTSTGYTSSESIRVLFLSEWTGYNPQLGTIILSKSLKRCWVENSYAKRVSFKLKTA
jgi:hypothetical protein